LVLSFGIKRWSNQNLYKGVQIWNKEIKENLIAVVVNDDQSIRIDSLAQVKMKPKKQIISNEEKILVELASKKELKISTYAKLEDVEIGDYVVFASPFGEQIFGIVDSIGKSNAIEIKTFPSIGNALIQKVIWSELRKVEMTIEAPELEK